MEEELDTRNAEELKQLGDAARYYEELYYSLKSNVGQVIYNDLLAYINGEQLKLRNKSAARLVYPYKYKEEDLHDLEILNSQVAALEVYAESLNLELLKEKVRKYRVELDQGTQEAVY
jgi:hypothetical protein